MRDTTRHAVQPPSAVSSEPSAVSREPSAVSSEREKRPQPKAQRSTLEAQSSQLVVCVCAAMLLCTATTVDAASLDDLIAASTQSPSTQPENAVETLLKTGVAENRAAEAVAAVSPWFKHNQPQNANTLFYAARASQLAGEWPAAVDLYRKFMQSKSVDRKMGDIAVTATYRLLLDDLQDYHTAYLYMREAGNRLRPVGRARQYDRWFLDEAQQRRDVVAVCDRLATILSDRSTDVARHVDDLRWVCQSLETFRPADTVEYEAAERLAAASLTPPEFKARLQWVTTVMPYNATLDRLRDAGEEPEAKLTDKPLAAAAQLIRVLPDRGPLLVAAGWGVEYDHHHSGNCAARFNVEGERKLAQLLDAIHRMSPERRDDLLAFPIAQGRVKFDPTSVRKLVVQYPDMLGTLTAADVPLYDKTLTVEEAKKLAPLLARSPHIHAALVRGVAATGNNRFSEIVAAAAKTEMWRFDTLRPLIDVAWRAGAEQDLHYNDVVKQYEKPHPRYEQLKKQCRKEASSTQRLAAFDTLRKDLLSPAPSIPGALPLLDELYGNATDAEKVQMVKALTTEADGEPHALLERILPHGQFVGRGALRSDAALDDNWEHYHHPYLIKAAGELADHFQAKLHSQLKAGKLSEPLLGMWLRCADPKNPQAQEFMKTLVASPVYAKVEPAYHRLAADRRYFDYLALTPELGATDSRYISRELRELPEEADEAKVAAALKTAMDRVAKAPVPLEIYGLKRVAELPDMNEKTRKLAMAVFTETTMDANRVEYEALARRLVRDIEASGDYGRITAVAPMIWRTPDLRSGFANELTDFAEKALDSGAISTAAAVARIGLQCNSPTDQGATERIARLARVGGKAAMAMGIIDIPVDKQHPAYPIYASQAEFAQGNLSAAWDLYHTHADQLQPIVRELTVQYCFWLLEQDIERRNTGRADSLVKQLSIWSGEVPGAFDPQQKARLMIAYADIALQQGKALSARAWYRRVADSDQYRGTPIQYEAILRAVAVDRMATKFADAHRELDKLLAVRDADVRTRAHLAKAEVYFDQELYADAMSELAAVLRARPKHEDALILRGKVDLEMRKLVEASEIELGVARDNEVIVPGELIKIDLNDPTLNVSGVSSAIEVTIAAESGDSETVMLHQLGDNKEKFRAEVPTELAAPVPGDKRLQVLGRDKIRFGYSKRFRQRMLDLPPDPTTVIGVASNARLDISAGAFPPRMGERRLNMDELGLSTAQKALGARCVRPGNPVYIRVIDPDQSRTAEVDEIAISVATSSGDVIERLVLKETGTHTGEFEAELPTAAAQALAYASDSAPGRDPNMAISAQPYPGWAGKVGADIERRTFTVDLNDSVDLGKMTLRCSEPGQQPTHFVVQTSLGGREWTNRARFPEDARLPEGSAQENDTQENGTQWDGRPWVGVVPTYGNDAAAVSSPDDGNLPEDWRDAMEVTSAGKAVGFHARIVDGLSTLGPIPFRNHPGYSVLMQYRAVFYQDSAAVRRFRLTGFPPGDENAMPQTIFLLDGRPADPESADPMTIQRELRPGLHEIQVWRHESRGELEKRKPVLLCDVPGEQQLVPCPDSMFDPSMFPEAVRAKIDSPARITLTSDETTQFDVEFGEHTKARLIRLVILDHEGVAPAIDKVTLTDAEGAARLPVAEDYRRLRSNKQLEVVPGDRLAVRYEDDNTIRGGRGRRERNLTVAFNTATIDASFLTFETTQEGRQFVFEKIRRFKDNDNVAIVIEDPDMDVSREPDEVRFTVSTSGGKDASFTAVETGPHTGVFRGRVFPVLSEPTEAAQIQVQEGGTLTASYRDMENLDPGIPTERTVTLEHAKYATPKFVLYDIDSQPLPPPKEAEIQGEDDDSGSEVVRPRRALQYACADQAASTKAVIGSHLRFDVVAPHLALAESSEIFAFVQTDAGRKAYLAAGNKLSDMPLDVNVPGTLKLTARPTAAAEIAAPLGYVIATPPTPPTNRPALDEGRFAFSVPLILGDLPDRSFATQAAESLPSSQIPEGLAVRAGDKVHIGFAYKDKQGDVQWHAAEVTVGSHAFLDVLADGYGRDLKNAYVGEKLYVRLVAPGLDRTSQRDTTTVTLKADSGATTEFQLRETFEHTGIFKGVFTLGYAAEKAPTELPSVELHGFPVRYGDELTVSYRDGRPAGPPACSVAVNRGADGNVEPFSKQYTEDAVAVKTNFTLAECYFELAKHHQKLQQESLSRREMGQAQKLLAEAIATHRDDEMRAHAEYLLGNLAQEYADLSKNEESKQSQYRDALARFTKIPLEYPDTQFAPKAQFKKALVYEKMGELDIAVEEYVKLAYKYPNDELIPMVMTRLGAYFQAHGEELKDRAKPLMEKKDDFSVSEVLRLTEEAKDEYIKAAVIFTKLQSRFPNDKLAGLAGLRAAQNYMRAEDFETAVEAFQKVIDTEEYDGKTIRAQAMYWCGLSRERLDNTRDAYETYRRTTFDFPDSLWAKYARGRLADPRFAKLIEEENLIRERHIEALKKMR